MTDLGTNLALIVPSHFQLYSPPSLSSTIQTLHFSILSEGKNRVRYPGGSVVNNPPTMQDTWVQSLDWEDTLEEAWQPTPVFLPEKSHGQRNLVGYHPKGGKESDTAEHARWLCHSFIPVLSSGMGRQRCAQQDRED